MKKRIISVSKYVLFLSIGVALLWLATKDQNIDTMLDHFKEANYLWVVVSILLGVLSHLFRAVRWNLLINAANYKTGTASTFYSVMLGYLANLAVPRLGEITRCGVLSKTKNIPFGLLVGTVISERAFDLLTLILLIFVTIIFQISLLGSFLDKYIFNPIASKFNGISSIFIIIGFIIGAIIVCYLIYRLSMPFIKRSKYFYKIKRLIVSFKSGIKTILKNDRKWLFFLYTLIIWLLYFLMLYVCFFTLKETSHLTAIDGLTIMVIGSLGIVAPVPGGIGAYHFIVSTLLIEIYLIKPGEAAVSFAYITHSTQMIMILFAGTISYFLILTLRKRNSKEAAK